MEFHELMVWSHGCSTNSRVAGDLRCHGAHVTRVRGSLKQGRCPTIIDILDIQMAIFFRYNIREARWETYTKVKYDGWYGSRLQRKNMYCSDEKNTTTWC